MSAQAAFDPWQRTIMTHLPHLSKAQARVLAWWSHGMILARSCALSAVSIFVAGVLKRKDNTVRQRLREWCYEARAKRGAKRQEIRTGKFTVQRQRTRRCTGLLDNKGQCIHGRR